MPERMRHKKNHSTFVAISFPELVPLDQRSENESSGSIHFEITKEITEFCISGFTAQCAVCIYGIYGANLKWMLPELSFSDRWQGERSSGNEIAFVGDSMCNVSST